MSSGEITQDLLAYRRGDQAAFDRLLQTVYEQLRRMSHHQLGPGSRTTLNTTALVHEAYIKLVDGNHTDWKDRDHFFAVAAKAMRHILIDHVRARNTQKRGGEFQPKTLDESRLGAVDPQLELLELDEALDHLQDTDERLAQLVELRFYGGLSEEEVASVLGISVRTARRDWRKARAFLLATLEGED